MDIVLITNGWVFVCALIGFLYGVRAFIKNGKILFARMITFGIACMMYARLFQIIFILTQGELKAGFDISTLGVAGSFMFLLSANYGQMDSLVDDGSKKFLHIRLISLVAPAIVIGLYALFLTKIDVPGIIVGTGIVTLFMIPCIYYNFKHLIIFDVDLGLIRTLRLYNVLAIAFVFSVGFEFFGVYTDNTPMFVAAMVIQGLLSIAIPLAVRKGVAKWTI